MPRPFRSHARITRGPATHARRDELARILTPRREPRTRPVMNALPPRRLFISAGVPVFRGLSRGSAAAASFLLALSLFAVCLAHFLLETVVRRFGRPREKADVFAGSRGWIDYLLAALVALREGRCDLINAGMDSVLG